tara:strand:+ start:1131 stop:2777 length:1647 start_codon:yes stop_codon:yes gene_type:complete
MFIENKEWKQKGITDFYNELSNKPFSHGSKQTIPLLCHVYYQHEHIPPFIKQNIMSFIRNNPTIKVIVYHEKQINTFIEQHGSSHEKIMFERLIPFSYKVDLWKYILLYKKGGMLWNPLYSLNHEFDFSTFFTQNHFVLEPVSHGISINNDLLVTQPNNPILLQCIEHIQFNIENCVVGYTVDHPTGNRLFGETYYNCLGLNEYITMFEERKTKNIFLHSILIGKKLQNIQEDTKLIKQWQNHAIYKHPFQIIQDTRKLIYNSSKPRLACIVHVGNDFVLRKMDTYLKVLEEYQDCDVDYYVNVIELLDNNYIDSLKKVFPNSLLSISNNIGFDLASFFNFLDIIKKEKTDYDYIVKIHTKVDDVFRNNSLYPLFGTQDIWKKNIEKMMENEKIGMVGSNEVKYIIKERDINELHMESLKREYNMEHFKDMFFVGGTMFLIRFSIIRNVFFDKDISLICNSFNTKETFDYNWYYYQVKNQVVIENNFQSCFDHYHKIGKTMKYYKNVLDSLRNGVNPPSNLHDGMIEHAYERFLCYIVTSLRCKIEWV